MNIAKHREKAERIEKSLAKLRSEDAEMRIEAAMLSATHWVNLAYHAMGVTKDDQDILHSYMLTVNEFRRLAAADEALITMLAKIEDLRPVYVRGDVPGAEKAADEAIGLLNEIRRFAQQATT
ncbi:hypothetical protein GJW-30_1_04391 [Variibacter gotjawalensis]|uniref:Uncharacterized protein n=1 Tax=Variibacter gotjawalensis TaxID=1333996 RepID=A0A0S3Q0X0_9BRAD|nr:hypothetical protein [Variibacter gotjawalensis]NIK47669.1 hypothetical protein [Variibacter gotjawalensis]RZS49567.1 hypothetical protein EV661_2002 [Variibacter gotjawalensis]BAT61829.1 hypothetical protein GJW-30_1_04391 [Variibacter gotjawalensis]